ncbi:MAG: hypothetical protein Tsb009_05030 [Planctomycetaceae bacterium]
MRLIDKLERGDDFREVISFFHREACQSAMPGRVQARIDNGGFHPADVSLGPPDFEWFGSLLHIDFYSKNKYQKTNAIDLTFPVTFEGQTQ